MPWERTPIKLPVPDELKDALSEIENFASNSESVLSALSSALDVAKALYIANADLFAAIVRTAIDKLQEFSDDFFGSGIFVLAVSPLEVGDTFAGEQMRLSLVVPQGVATDSNGQPIENGFVKFSPLTEEQRLINETEKSWFGEGGVKGVYRVANITGPTFNNFGFKFLTPRQCADAMARSFYDRGDAKRPQFSGDATVSAFGFIVTAPTLDGFLTVASSLLALFDLDDLRKIVERVTKLQIEKQQLDQGILPASQLPDWDSRQLSTFDPFKKMQATVQKGLDSLKGYAVSDADVVTDLIDLIQKKADTLADISEDFGDLVAGINQGLSDTGVLSLNYPASTGGVNALVKDLEADSVLDEIDNKFSYGILFVGGVPGSEPSALITEPVEKLRSLIF